MARSECSSAADLGPLLVSAARFAVTQLRQHMSADDPKVVVRAVAEFTKLLNVCGKLGLSLPEEAPAPPPQRAPSEESPPAPVVVATPIAAPQPIRIDRSKLDPAAVAVPCEFGLCGTDIPVCAGPHAPTGMSVPRHLECDTLGGFLKKQLPPIRPPTSG